MIDVRYNKVDEDAIPFKYSREYDACMDMYSNTEARIPSGERMIIPTGIRLEIPPGYKGIVRGRSGMASRSIDVHYGTIDENYRGEVGVIVINLSDDDYFIHKGDRVAQLAIEPAFRVKMTESEVLSSTSRGESGYGSSGI